MLPSSIKFLNTAHGSGTMSGKNGREDKMIVTLWILWALSAIALVGMTWMQQRARLYYGAFILVTGALAAFLGMMGLWLGLMIGMAVARLWLKGDNPWLIFAMGLLSAWGGSTLYYGPDWPSVLGVGLGMASGWRMAVRPRIGAPQWGLLSSLGKVKPYKQHVLVCYGDLCQLRGAIRVRKGLVSFYRNHQGGRVTTTACMNDCRNGPIVWLEPPGKSVQKFKLGDIPEVLGKNHGGDT